MVTPGRPPTGARRLCSPAATRRPPPWPPVSRLARPSPACRTRGHRCTLSSCPPPHGDAWRRALSNDRRDIPASRTSGVWTVGNWMVACVRTAKRRVQRRQVERVAPHVILVEVGDAVEQAARVAREHPVRQTISSIARSIRCTAARGTAWLLSRALHSMLFCRSLRVGVCCNRARRRRVLVLGNPDVQQTRGPAEGPGQQASTLRTASFVCATPRDPR